MKETNQITKRRRKLADLGKSKNHITKPQKDLETDRYLRAIKQKEKSLAESKSKADYAAK